MEIHSKQRNERGIDMSITTESKKLTIGRLSGKWETGFPIDIRDDERQPLRNALFNVLKLDTVICCVSSRVGYIYNVEVYTDKKMGKTEMRNVALFIQGWVNGRRSK